MICTLIRKGGPEMKWLVGLGLMFGCGVSPVEADRALMEMDLTEVCGEDHTLAAEGFHAPQPELVEKIFNRPEGFGSKFSDTSRCFSPVSYPCYLPGVREFDIKVGIGVTDPWWGDAVNSRDRFADFMSDVYPNGPQWGVKAYDGSAPWQVRIGTTHPSGYLGVSTKKNVVVQSSGQGGQYNMFYGCHATLYRDSIEANSFYASASSTARMHWRRNLWSHEMYHCVGLGHETVNWNELMSVTYSDGGVWMTGPLGVTETEKNRLANYYPF